MKQQHIEKRKFPRFPAENEYILILNEEKHEGVIGNISLGGVYLKTISPSITENSLFQDCEIMMNLSDTNISMSCSISFVGAEHSKHAPGVGIVFSTVDEKSLTVLTHFIEKIQEPI